MSARLDTGAQLAHALRAAAGAQDCAVAAELITTSRWASATFNGARHRLRLTAAPSASLDQWLAGLGDQEFAIRGHLVADLTTHAIERRGAQVEVDLEILTLEDR